MRAAFEEKKISYCAEQVRRHDSGRFLCAQFAPADKREGLLALHAFELELAQIEAKVREPMMGRIRLAWWREAIDELYTGTVRGHQVLQALAAEGVPRNVPQAHLTAMIDAHEALFEEEPFPTGEALLDYARGVGVSSLQGAAEVLGCAADAASEAGTGLALTNYLRALPILAANGRLGLPSDLMGQMDIDPYVMTPANLERVKTVVSLIAEEARRLLNSHRGNEVHRETLPAFLPVVLAKHYLKRLAKADYNPFAPELNAPNPWKPLQLARAWATGKV